MTAVELWRRMLAGEPGDNIGRPGNLHGDGVRAPGARDLQPKSLRRPPVLQTIVRRPTLSSRIGLRAHRPALDQPTIVDDVFTDPYGVDWLWSEVPPHR